MPVNILTNVQKLELNNVSIPGFTGPFACDINAIVNVDRNIVYRTIPQSKELVTNQIVVAQFEEAAMLERIGLTHINDSLLFGGAQMCREYKIPLENDYHLTVYLWNAYNKGNGHFMYSVLNYLARDTGDRRFTTERLSFPLSGTLSEIDMTGTTLEATQEKLRELVLQAYRDKHFWEWAATKEITDPRQLLSPVINGFTQTLARNMYWPLRNDRIPLRKGLGIIYGTALGTQYLANTTASPTEHSRKAKIRKAIQVRDRFAETLVPHITEYRYEEPAPTENVNQADTDPVVDTNPINIIRDDVAVHDDDAIDGPIADTAG